MNEHEALKVAEAVMGCVEVAGNPGFIECRDTDWDEGVNYAKRFIKQALVQHLMSVECHLNAETGGKYLPQLSQRFVLEPLS